MKKIRVFSLLLALFCSLTATTYAGSGGGENSNVALSLQNSSPADGSSGVAPDTAITLDFNKNVVNLAVREHNMTCFSVTDSSGAPVEIVVEMGDDQVDREIRRTVVVCPAGQWPAGETLTLTVSGQLTAKNGTTMDTPVSVTFQTAAADPLPPEAPVPPTEAPQTPEPSQAPGPAPSPAAPVTPDPQPSPTPPAVTDPSPSAPPEPPESSRPIPAPPAVPSVDPDSTPPGNSKDTSAGPNAALPLLLAVCAAAVLVAICIFRTKKKKS